MNTKTFVIGDIHNNYKALLQCMIRSNFNYDTDTLVCLGDIYDGYPDAHEVAEELLKIKNLILIMGNHDHPWVYNYFTKGSLEYIHLSQGGQATVNSYKDKGIPESHIKLLENAVPYYLDDKNRLFVHGGIDLNIPLEDNSVHNMMWDRSLLQYAHDCHYTKSCTIPKKLQTYNEIYIGHTSTEFYEKGYIPLHYCNVWALDTGCGYDGKLTIMNIDTHEYWQSDTGTDLYGPDQGR